MAAKTITITKTEDRLDRSRSIDIVLMNEETFRDCLEILIRSGTLGAKYAGTKGFMGWALLVQAFLKKGHPRLSNSDAMDTVLGFVVFIMTNSGSPNTLQVADEEDFVLIGKSWDKFRNLLTGAYEAL